jgi:hypothetical protein
VNNWPPTKGKPLVPKAVKSGCGANWPFGMIYL